VTDLPVPDGAALIRSLARPGTLVVLDFDGTLAPIVGDRHAAGMTRRSRAALAAVARLYPVAILTGRSARDVRSRLQGVAVRWVIGSHGLEWPGESVRRAAWRRQVRRWIAPLSARLAGWPGIELEVKPLALAVHHRGAPPASRAEARILRATLDLPGVATVLGKKVVNLMPRSAGDKGTALARLAGMSRARRLIFVGDDVTDEAAFAARLPIPAVTVRVGRALATCATYGLPRRSGVDLLLERLASARLARPDSVGSRRGPAVTAARPSHR